MFSGKKYKALHSVKVKGKLDVWVDLGLFKSDVFRAKASKIGKACNILVSMFPSAGIEGGENESAENGHYKNLPIFNAFASLIFSIV